MVELHSSRRKLPVLVFMVFLLGIFSLMRSAPPAKAEWPVAAVAVEQPPSFWQHLFCRKPAEKQTPPADLDKLDRIVQGACNLTKEIDSSNYEIHRMQSIMESSMEYNRKEQYAWSRDNLAELKQRKADLLRMYNAYVAALE